MNSYSSLPICLCRHVGIVVAYLCLVKKKDYEAQMASNVTFL
jgi:hypothetical protein